MDTIFYWATGDGAIYSFGLEADPSLEIGEWYIQGFQQIRKAQNPLSEKILFPADSYVWAEPDGQRHDPFGPHEVREWPTWGFILNQETSKSNGGNPERLRKQGSLNNWIVDADRYYPQNQNLWFEHGSVLAFFCSTIVDAITHAINRDLRDLADYVARALQNRPRNPAFPDKSWQIEQAQRRIQIGLAMLTEFI